MSDAPPSYLPEHPPVQDWVNDFDHTDPTWTEDPFPIWEELRAASPVVHTERFLGCYMPTTYEAVKQIAYDTEHFSSRRVIVRDVRPETVAKSPPITSDPPEHKPAKQLLLPPFTPDAMKKLEPRVRAICNELIDGFIDDGRCDAAGHYAKHIPVRAIAHMLGIPEKDGDLFIKWIHEILELGIKDDPLLDLAMELEKIALNDKYFVDRKLYPNVDFYSGIVQRAIGIPVPLFTAIFALARTVGWIAQLNEMIGDPEYKIGRPRQLFVGSPARQVKPSGSIMYGAQLPGR